MKITIYTCIVVLLLIGCHKRSESPIEPIGKYPPENKELVTIHEGIWGNVWFWEGSFMPVGWGNITPVSRKIYFYQITRWDSVEPPSGTWVKKIHSTLIDSTVSGTNGFYQKSLAPGEYSVFVREDTSYYVNWFTDRNSVWYILPVPVKKDSTTKYQIDVTYKATF